MSDIDDENHVGYIDDDDEFFGFNDLDDEDDDLVFNDDLDDEDHLDEDDLDEDDVVARTAFNLSSSNPTTLELIKAVDDGNVETVREILQRPEVTAADLNGFGDETSPLMFAMLRFLDRYPPSGACPVASLLLSDPRVDPNCTHEDSYGHVYSALAYALNRRQYGVAQALARCPRVRINDFIWHDSAQPNGVFITPLGWAAREGQTELVRAIMNHPDVDVNASSGRHDGIPVRDFYEQAQQDGDVHTALYHAVNGINFDVVKLLVTDPRTDIRCFCPFDLAIRRICSSSMFSQCTPESAPFDIADLFMRREAARVSSDRARIKFFSRQVVVDVPEQIMDHELLPMLGQILVTQETVNSVVHEVTSAYDKCVLQPEDLPEEKLLGFLEYYKQVITIVNVVLGGLKAFVEEYGDIKQISFPTCGSTFPTCSGFDFTYVEEGDPDDHCD